MAYYLAEYRLDAPALAARDHFLREHIYRLDPMNELAARFMPRDMVDRLIEARFGARFQFRARPMGDWNGVVDCEVTVLDPPRRLVYTWKGGSVENRGPALDSVVEWTLTEVSGGTRVRMEHSGFGPRNASAYDVMSGGWPRVLERLEEAAGRLQPA